MQLEEILILIRHEPDPVKRLKIRLKHLPLGYLATTEAKRDIEAVLARLPNA